MKNTMIQKFIQKVHLEIFVEKAKIFFVELYFRINWNIFVIILSYLNYDQKTVILTQQKKIIQELEKQCVSIVFSQKNIHQNLIRNLKSFQNTGVNCDILSISQHKINRQILSYLKDNVPQSQKNSSSNIEIIPPTKQMSISINKHNLHQSLMSERQSKKHIQMKSFLTERPDTNKNIKDLQNSNLDIKRQKRAKQFQVSNSKGKQYLEDKAFKNIKNSIQQSQKNKAEHKINYLTQFQEEKNYKSEQLKKSFNPNNMAIMDINMSQNSSILKNSLSKSNCLQEQIVKSEVIQHQQNTQPFRAQKLIQSFLPSGVNISSIQVKKSHPFQINLSNLSDPLRISKHQYKSSSQKLTNLKFFSSANLQNKEKEKPIQPFSQSSIANKFQNSVSQSEYSDIFDSDQEENKVQCKVQAVVQKQKKQNEPKPRLQIYMIQLYTNSDLKFYSLYDKVVFQGRLLRMLKKPDNYYDLIVQQYKNDQQSNMQNKKSQKEKQQEIKKIQLTKKVKFRGQAKLFMKYLIK